MQCLELHSAQSNLSCVAPMLNVKATFSLACLVKNSLGRYCHTGLACMLLLSCALNQTKSITLA